MRYINKIRNSTGQIYPADLTILGRVMKREEIARTLAREAGLSNSAARDQVDELVHTILRKLREGKKVTLPGVGKLVGSGGRRPR